MRGPRLGPGGEDIIWPDWGLQNDRLLDSQLWLSWDTGYPCRRILVALQLRSTERVKWSLPAFLQLQFRCPEGLTKESVPWEQHSGRLCYHVSAVPGDKTCLGAQGRLGQGCILAGMQTWMLVPVTEGTPWEEGAARTLDKSIVI